MNALFSPSRLATHMNPWMRQLQLATLASALMGGSSASALVINLTYDPDATFTTAGLSAADIVNMKAATSYAAAQFTNNFSDNVHVNVSVTAVSGTGTLGSSSVPLTFVSFATLKAKVLADATTADDMTATGGGGSLLLATNPIPGSSYLVTRAEAKALGITADNAVTSDGTFTFGGGFSYTYDPNNRAVSGKFDYIGMAMNEISQIMGRIGLMGQNLDGNPDYMLMDLFHYTGAGVRGLNKSFGRSFSFDNGTTLLKGFNDAASNGGNFYNWASGANDAFNAFGGSGVSNALTLVDLQVMDVLGYNRIISVVPEPSLAISGNAPNVILSWGTNAAGFALEQTPSLANSNLWVTNFAATSILGTNFVVTNGINAGQQFFRLMKP